MNFVDMQIAGYAGVNFLGEPPTIEQMRHVASKLREHGVEKILVSLATDDLDRLCARITALRGMIDRDASLRELMPAFHIEGPCISPVDGFRGAHPLAFVRPAEIDLFKRLLDACGGPGRLALVTLAPEVDHQLRATRWLVEQGILVSAGHTDAPLDVLREAEQAGVRLFTHLGNGCAKLLDRHDNILHRALSLEQVSYTLIADGHHVPWFVLREWIKHVGVERCVLISDAVSAAAAPPGRYPVMDIEVEVGPERKVTMPGTPYLAGSALTMPRAYENAVKYLGVTAKQALVMARDNPRRLLGW